MQDDRSTSGLLAKPLQNFQNHLYGQPILTFDQRQIRSESWVFEWTLIELCINIIKNLCLFFI